MYLIDAWAESWITQCGSRLIYELLPGKEVVYVVPVSSVLGRLPVVRAGDTGTIPFKYCAGLRNGGHRYNHNAAILHNTTHYYIF